MNHRKIRHDQRMAMNRARVRLAFLADPAPLMKILPGDVTPVSIPSGAVTSIQMRYIDRHGFETAL